MQERLEIDVYFDLICPWCWIGKRHLESALAAFATERPEVALDVRWHGKPLLPDIPAGGVPFQAFYEQRLGGTEAVEARQAQVREAGRLAGLEFDFASITTMPNTLAAHSLVATLAELDQTAGRTTAPALIEALFAAYFQQGRNIGDPAELAAIASDLGLHLPETIAPRRTAIPSVPFFVFNDRRMLAGALPPERLLAVMRLSVDEAVA